MADFHYSIELDPVGCKACGYCKIVCPKGVYEQGREINSRGYKYFYPVNSESCIGCMRCFYICPDFCLEVKPIEKEVPDYEKTI
jgi:NAD-dependent dihydropyrimidine dehydrogenase PreA subunit